MANETLDQSASVLQALKKRIAHLDLLIGYVREEIIKAGFELPEKLNNDLQEASIALNNAKEELAYLINKQDDIELQQQNEPLIIKSEGKE